MTNVMRAFFITKEEAEKQKQILGFGGFINYRAPHYELADGSIMWAMEDGQITFWTNNITQK